LSYVDAHIHLTDPGYIGKVEAVLDNAARNGITYLLSNAVDYGTSLHTISLAKRQAGHVLAAVGLHPWTVVNSGNSDQTKFEPLLDEHGQYVSAIGEIGLDGKYTQDEEKTSLQKETFRFFLRLAEKRRLPVVIHSRLALNDVLDELSRFDLSRVLMHWYDGPTEKLKLIQDRGYVITVGPSLLYSKRVAEVARTADLEMILTETDGPVSYHGTFEGKMTQPSFVIDVVRALAELKSLNVETIRDAVSSNFQRFIMPGSNA
jgi:TatD DNase family protein